MTKRYCEGIDYAWCQEKSEPCIYKVANELQAENEKLKNALIEIKVNFINQSARNGLSKFENEIFIKIDKVLSP